MHPTSNINIHLCVQEKFESFLDRSRKSLTSFSIFCLALCKKLGCLSKCCELRNNCLLLTFLGSLRCTRSIFDFGISISALCINSSNFSSAFSCVSSFLHGFLWQVLQLWFIAFCWKFKLVTFLSD